MRDIEDLRSLGVSPAPLHLSNSTDLLQSALERKYGHTLFALKLIAKYRTQFTSLVILTTLKECFFIFSLQFWHLNLK